jgi:hypothetical protein
MAILNPRRAWRRRTWARALLASLALVPALALSQVDESRLKAAFVYNIVAFASWQGAAAAEPLHICAVTGSQLDIELAALSGRMVGRRKINVQRGSVDPACDVLVHAGGTGALPAATPASALVVCDGCTVGDGHSAVLLARDGDRVRFDVDAGAANRSGVAFSSQLLRLARRVL